MRKILLILTLFTFSIVAACEASPQTYITEATYQAGDSDSPVQAQDTVLLMAERQVLEQAGVLVTSSSTVKNFELKDDTIRSLSSGLLQVTVLEKRRTPIGNGTEFYIKIRATVDPDEVKARLSQKDVITSTMQRKKVTTINYNVENETMNLLLIRGVQTDNIDMIKTALNSGANVNIYFNDKNATPLFIAILHYSFESRNQKTLAIVKYLLEQNADPNVMIGENGIAGMEPMLFNGYIINNETPFEIYELLIKNGLDITSTDLNSNNILTRIMNGSVSAKYKEEFVKFFISKDADVNYKNRAGNTPLHIAAARNYVKITKILLDARARTDILNNDFKKPIDLALANNADEILINMLMKNN